MSNEVGKLHEWDIEFLLTQSPNSVPFRRDVFIKSRFEISILKLKERNERKCGCEAKNSFKYGSRFSNERRSFCNIYISFTLVVAVMAVALYHMVCAVRFVSD